MNDNDHSSLTEGINRKPSAAADAPGVLVFPPLAYLGTLVLALVLHWFWPRHLPLAPWMRIGGGGLILCGGLLALWGRNTMVRAGTNVIPTRPTLAIVTAGPFRFTRNPLYVGNLVVYVGLTLSINSLWLLLLLIPMLAILRWGIIAREERYLETKFGDDYLAYKTRVRRWL